jgi:hypothetical protein
MKTIRVIAVASVATLLIQQPSFSQQGSWRSLVRKVSSDRVSGRPASAENEAITVASAVTTPSEAEAKAQPGRVRSFMRKLVPAHITSGPSVAEIESGIAPRTTKAASKRNASEARATRNASIWNVADKGEKNYNIFKSTSHEVSFFPDDALPEADTQPANVPVVLEKYVPAPEPTLAAAFDDTPSSEPLDGNLAPIVSNNTYNQGACGGCQTYCCQPCQPCCPAFWEHRSGVYAEYLYLTARDANVAYATPTDGVGVNAVPRGPVSIADPDYEDGFRTGFAIALDKCSSFTANYTNFDSLTTHETTLSGGATYLTPHTIHPGTNLVITDVLSADARLDIDFELIDANFKGLIWGGCNHSLNYLLGLRYASLEQNFLATYFILNGTTTVDTNIDFEGFGPRIGLEGERLIRGGFLVYAKGAANFLAGEFKTDYVQRNVFVPAIPQANTAYEDDRIVTLMELEMGVGWQNCCGTCRVTAGYYLAGWRNSILTPEYINAVQADDFSGLNDTMTFDGLTAKAEWRF